MNKSCMAAIFELHIPLPHIPSSVGHKNDKERKSSHFLKLCLDLSSTATVCVVFEMEKLRSPHSPTVSVIQRFLAIELTVLIRLCPSLASQAVVVFRRYECSLLAYDT
jgi:hypothetical protein